MPRPSFCDYSRYFATYNLVGRYVHIPHVDCTNVGVCIVCEMSHDSKKKVWVKLGCNLQKCKQLWYIVTFIRLRLSVRKISVCSLVFVEFLNFWKKKYFLEITYWTKDDFFLHHVYWIDVSKNITTYSLKSDFVLILENVFY